MSETAAHIEQEIEEYFTLSAFWNDPARVLPKLGKLAKDKLSREISDYLAFWAIAKAD